MVWQKSMSLALVLNKLIKKFPPEERFALQSQIMRSSYSIASNIAEGSSRRSPKAFLQYLEIALGSSFEFETQMILASQLAYLSSGEIESLSDSIVEIQRMLLGLIDKQRSDV